MAVIIDQHLVSIPPKIHLPRSTVQLRQTLHTDRTKPETVVLTYSLDGRTAIFFEVDGKLQKSVVMQKVVVPREPTQRTDTLTLVEDGDTAMALIEIDQEIDGETTVFDAVTLEVVE